jgi:hypothetical protein
MPGDDVNNHNKLQTRVEFLEEKLLSGIEAVREHQVTMCDDISKIKEAVYNPDTGLYARLRAVEDQVKNYSKFLWMILTMAIGSLAAFITTQVG